MSTSLIPDSYFELFAIDDDGSILTSTMSLLQAGRQAAEQLGQEDQAEQFPVEEASVPDEGEVPHMLAAYDVAMTLLPDIWARAQMRKTLNQQRSRK